jgi:hypothetical protein
MCGRMMKRFLILLATLSISACTQPTAPMESGVCWLSRTGGAPFTPLARNVDNLETCAVLLEARRLQGQSDTNGAYQGYFIFVDDRQISSAMHTRGFRYPILQPPQRAAIDRDLKALLKDHGGQLPDASQLSVERK